MFQSPDILEAESCTLRRVLVVDDEPTLRLGYAYALSNPRIRVEAAASGKEALKQIAEAHFDLILLDLRMPEMDGMDVIAALRGQAARMARGAAIPIILCSGLTEPQATLRAIRHGVVDFLLKPMRPADLRGAVEFVLHPHEYPLSAALQEARQLRPERAIAMLEEQASGEELRALQWLKVLKAIRDAPAAAETPGLAEAVRRRFPKLAFNSLEAQ